MDNTEFDSKISCTQCCNNTHSSKYWRDSEEQIPINVNSANIATSFRDYSKQYAYYYKSFYNEALRHFECELSDY